MFKTVLKFGVTCVRNDHDKISCIMEHVKNDHV